MDDKDRPRELIFGDTVGFTGKTGVNWWVVFNSVPKSCPTTVCTRPAIAAVINLGLPVKSPSIVADFAQPQAGETKRWADKFSSPMACSGYYKSFLFAW
jgi:hypothetical protein